MRDLARQLFSSQVMIILRLPEEAEAQWCVSMTTDGYDVTNCDTSSDWMPIPVKDQRVTKFFFQHDETHMCSTQKFPIGKRFCLKG